MASVAFRARIARLDTSTGELKDITRAFPDYAIAALRKLKQNYDRYQLLGSVPPECGQGWHEVLDEAYRTAWFTLLLGGGIVSTVAFLASRMGSRRWRLAARLVGALVTVVSLAVAFYSLGTFGWHFVGFCDAWVALEVLSGFRVHSRVVEVISVLLTLYEGFQLLTS
jgi:hypothetical protein